MRLPHLSEMSLLNLWQSLPHFSQKIIKQKETQLHGDRLLFWRAILGGALTYSEACVVDTDTLYEANAALNKKIEDERAQYEANK